MYPNPVSPYHSINTTRHRKERFDTLYYGYPQSLRAVYHPALRDFFRFIRKMEVVFEKVRVGMDYENKEASHRGGDDRHTGGWAGIGMMPIAIYLYYLTSYGIKGKVLECGVFKGGSTCCLSHVCHELGLELIAADSYEGLPSGDGFYGKGDFRGSLEEVQANINRLGRPGAVRYLRGWFSDSLRNFSDDIMLIWLDVDLRQSVIDVLSHTYDHLMKHGVIFCDGLGESRDFSGEFLKPGSSESAGLLDFFHEREISHKAVYSGFGHMGLVIPGVADEERLIYSPRLIRSILMAARPLPEKIRYCLKRLRCLPS